MLRDVPPSRALTRSRHLTTPGRRDSMVQGMVQWEGQTAHCHIVPTLENLVTPHVHFSPVMLLASVAATVAVFGTLHLLALTNDNRASRAFVSLGF